MLIQKKQSGFALVEVMMAALVLTVGGVAFMKLQRIGLQNSTNDYARNQGTAIAGNFIEQLRGNVDYMDFTAGNNGSIIAGITPTTSSGCNASAACTAFDYQRYLISLQMQNTLSTGQSILCYRQHPTTDGYLRVTFIWNDKISTTGAALTATSCPNSFNAVLNNTNSVDIYARL